MDKNVSDLKLQLTGIWGKAADAIAEMMRRHNCDELDLRKYEYGYDLNLPCVTYYMDNADYMLTRCDDKGFIVIVTKPATLRLYPGCIGIELDDYNGGGYAGFVHDTGLDAVEMVELYNVVAEIFNIIDSGTEPYHEYPEKDNDGE